MNEFDDAFEELRTANPVPTVRVKRPDASGFVASLDGDEQFVDQPLQEAGARPGNTHLTLVAAAAVVLIVGFSLWLASSFGDRPAIVEQVGDPPVRSSSIPSEPSSTTSARPSTTTTHEGESALIDAETQRLLDRFTTTYNNGDVDAFLALVTPGLNREVIVDADRRVYSEEILRDLFLIEADLHTEITFACVAGPDMVSCTPLRFDDLHRVLGVPPTEGDVWNLRFDEAGLIRSWNERRQNIADVDDYEREVTGPFMDWVRENHPEIGELRPAVGAEWILSKRLEIAEMVAAFAESRGIELKD